MEENYIRICAPRDSDTIVCINAETTDGYVGSSGDGYGVDNLSAWRARTREGLEDEVMYEIEKSQWRNLITIDYNALDSVVTEIEDEEITFEEDNIILIDMEGGQMDELDNYEFLKKAFGEDIADQFKVIRDLHLKSDSLSLKAAKSAIETIKSIAESRGIPTSPEEAYKKYRDMFLS